MIITITIFINRLVPVSLVASGRHAIKMEFRGTQLFFFCGALGETLAPYIKRFNVTGRQAGTQSKWNFEARNLFFCGAFFCCTLHKEI